MVETHNNNDGHSSTMDRVNSELQEIVVDEALIAEILEHLKRKEVE